MAQKKSYEVDAWLAKPQPDVLVVLCYGPDRGLVAERARRFARSTGLPLDDPFVVVKFDAATLEKDPGRLLDEAQAVAMFAAHRLLWVRGAGADRRLAEDVKALLDHPAPDTLLLIEAGDLKKGAALRTAVEAAPGAMALPCYPDSERDLDRLIDDELGRAGLEIGIDARAILRASLGGDRLASRGELEKLCLYVAGQKRVETEDVTNAVSDVAETLTDSVIDAVATGDPDGADLCLSRALGSSGAGHQVLAGLVRHFQALHQMRSAVDGGAGIASVIAAARPPVLLGRRVALERCLALWSAERIQRILARLQSVILSTRRRPDLAEAAIRQTCLGIAMEAANKRRR